MWLGEQGGWDGKEREAELRAFGVYFLQFLPGPWRPWDGQTFPLSAPRKDFLKENLGAPRGGWSHLLLSTPIPHPNTNPGQANQSFIYIYIYTHIYIHIYVYIYFCVKKPCVRLIGKKMRERDGEARRMQSSNETRDKAIT